MEHCNDKRYYEEMWRSSTEQPVGCRSNTPSESIEKLLNKILRTKTAFALDVGCGAGRHTTVLIKQGYKVVSLDFAFEALKRVKTSQQFNAFLVQGYAEKLPFESEIFQVIIDSGCLHHLRTEQFSIYTQELHRVTASQGYLILYQFGKRGTKIINWEGEHCTHYFAKGTIKSLFNCGWTILELNRLIGERGNPYLECLLQKNDCSLRV